MKNLIKYKDKKPLVHDSVYLAEGVNIIGDVEIDENTSIWFNTVIRGDVNYVRIGKNCNIQDGTIIHVSSHGFSARGKKGSPTIIGNYVTVGHNATIHACKIGDYSLIGMGSVILDQSLIENNAFIAAGAVVTPGSLVKSKELWAGNPARLIRKITETEQKLLVNTPEVYYQLSKEFLKK